MAGRVPAVGWKLNLSLVARPAASDLTGRSTLCDSSQLLCPERATRRSAAIWLTESLTLRPNRGRDRRP